VNCPLSDCGEGFTIGPRKSQTCDEKKFRCSGTSSMDGVHLAKGKYELEDPVRKNIGAQRLGWQQSGHQKNPRTKGRPMAPTTATLFGQALVAGKGTFFAPKTWRRVGPNPVRGVCDAAGEAGGPAEDRETALRPPCLRAVGPVEAESQGRHGSVGPGLGRTEADRARWFLDGHWTR